MQAKTGGKHNSSQSEIVYVVDTSYFILGCRIGDGRIVTVQDVVEELGKFDELNAAVHVDVEAPSSEAVEGVRTAARKTGDYHKLSDTDTGLLALALDYKNAGESAPIITDDYAVQNVAVGLGIEIAPIKEAPIKEVVEWVMVCRGCKKAYREEELGEMVCPVCGSEVRRKRAGGHILNGGL